MPPNPFLVERDFVIEQDGAIYRITAKAVYYDPSFGEQPYELVFTSKGQDLELYEPNKRRCSRAEAQVAAENLFASGFVEAHIKANLKDWIFLKNLSPDSVKR
jgi:hypothetical protein